MTAKRRLKEYLNQKYLLLGQDEKETIRVTVSRDTKMAVENIMRRRGLTLIYILRMARLMMPRGQRFSEKYVVSHLNSFTE